MASVTPLVIAHRGASHEAPENTVAAFRRAWEQGADAVETDLRLTRDGSVVAFHDRNAARTAGDPRRISSLTLDEIRTLDAGRWKDPKWASEKIPLLTELLDGTPAGGALVLELKEGAALVDRLHDTLAASDFLPARITLIAFDYAIIRRAKQRLPACRALWLFRRYEASRIRGKSRLGQWLAERAIEGGLDGVDLKNHPRLDRGLLDPLLAHGLLAFTYTVNDSGTARRLAAAGISGITTDRPGDLRRWLAASQPT